jgi:hypothetical protein
MREINFESLVVKERIEVVNDSKLQVLSFVGQINQNNSYSISDNINTFFESGTFDTILDLSEKVGVTPVELFNNLHIRDIMQLIQERQLSPWFLLCSKKFKEKLAVASEDDSKQLMKLIGINYWASKLVDNEKEVNEIKQIVNALEL